MGSMYEDKTVMGKSKEGQTVREKAQLYDNMQRQNDLRSSYDNGAKDLYTEVERQIIAQAKQDEMDRKMNEAYLRSQTQLDPINQSLVDLRGAIGDKLSQGANYVGKAINGLGDYLLNAAIGTPEQQSQYKDLGQQQQREMQEYQAQQAFEAAKKRGEM